VAEPIFLFGVGGHARSVYEVVARQGTYEVTAVLDDDPGVRDFRGVEVLGGRQQFASLAETGPHLGVIAIGSNLVRRELTALARQSGLSLVAVVDPAAVVARDIDLGAGTVVMPGVVVNVGTTIGRNVILNTACTVDHDCRIADYAHLSPGVHVSGECEIGECAHVGIGASVLQRVRIGDGATVGAGAAVTKDVRAGAVAVGVPARELER
jgi:sugar O-acyltransferase (sialic acid O-acetyltransferase NeuD family)